MPDNTNGTIIGLLPAKGDPIVAASSEPAHITMLWFGEADDLSKEDVQIIAGAAADWAEKADGPITASVESRGVLGDDGADVVFVDGEGLRAFRDGMAADERLSEIMARVKQYDTWKPHVTLGYPETPALAEYDGDSVTFDRLVIWVGTQTAELALGGGEEPPVDEETKVDETEPGDEEMAAALEEVGGDPVPWHGVLAPVDVESGDKRIFATGSISSRELPLPIKWQKEDMEGHFTSIVVANLTRIWEEDGLIKGEGFFASTKEAAEVIGLRAEDMVRGMSVDLDNAEIEFRTRSGKTLSAGDPIPPDTDPVLTVVTAGRIASATIVAIPAFQEAWFDLGTWEDEVQMQADGECEDCNEEAVAAAGGWGAPVEDVDPECEEVDENGDCIPSEEPEAVTADGATFAPGTKDGPGWITHPEDTARIRRYWTHGKGAAKIRWGAPGDFNRCRKQLVKYVQNPDWLAGLCANMHKEALGFWPAQHHRGESMTASGTPAPAFTLVDPEEALVAAAAKLPSSWFANPELDGPHPLTVTEDGRVFGHAATWSQCHIGMDKCITAPKSLTDYAYFHVGAVLTDAGEVPVGHITMGTGHASLNQNAQAAAAHYDNTGTVIADVHAGEDKHGIWLAGAVRASATDDQVHALRAAAISGDWRRIGAGMELVAALAVNTPGFPIPRTAIAASGAREDALVAAAVVEQEAPPQEDGALRELVAETARQTLAEYFASVRRAETVQKLRAEAAIPLAELRAHGQEN